MKLFNIKERVILKQRLSAVQVRWASDSLLFKVTNGSNKLNKRFGNYPDGKANCFLLLNGEPLMAIHCDNYYCPTCEKLIAAGVGLVNVDENLVNTLKISQTAEIDIEEAYNGLKPLLSILENGFYILSRINMIPTDGEGSFFWNTNTNNKYYKATADTLYKYHYDSGTPKFIYPTQPMARLDCNQVEFYREEIRLGKKMTGLAYYMDSYMCALLDGHHRATAACLEGVGIDCITIIPIDTVGYDSKGKADSIYAGGERFDIDVFKDAKDIIKSTLNELKSSKLLRLSDNELIKLNEKVGHDMSVTLPSELEVCSKKYPDYMNIAFSGMIKDTSEETIEALFNRHDDDAEFELEISFKVIMQESPERAFYLAKRIIKDCNCVFLWFEAYKYLSTFRTEEVEDIFVKYLIDYDYDKRDKIRALIESYLNVL